MKRKPLSKEQIIGILEEAEAGAVMTELCCKNGLPVATFYVWKVNHGGLEDENARLKRLLAYAMLDNAGLKNLLSKSGERRGQA